VRGRCLRTILLLDSVAVATSLLLGCQPPRRYGGRTGALPLPVGGALGRHPPHPMTAGQDLAIPVAAVLA